MVFSDLITLWQQRDQLDTRGWETLYKLVCGSLKRCNPSILSVLPENKEYYIQDFFLLKVFEPARHESNAPSGPGELCSYFKNFLIDVYRAADQQHRELFLEFDELVEKLPAVDCAAEDEWASLREHGLSPESVHESARLFLLELEEVEQLYLALHVCADAPQPLYQLAEQYRIPSYHYRARQLGITRKKGEFQAGYEQTRIGHWITTELGLGLENIATIGVVFKILCLVSFNHHQSNRSHDA